MIRSVNLNVCKEMLVSLCGYRSSDLEGTLRVDSISPMDLHVAMRRNRGYGQKEWLAILDCVMKKGFRFLSQDISGVLPLVADRGVSIPLPSAIEIFVRVRVQEEIRASISCWIRCTIVLNRMCIEKLASIVGIISSILEPYREILLI